MPDLAQIEALLAPVLTDHGMEIVDLEFARDQRGWVLRLFVDRPEGTGVTVEDCARVSRDCSAVLDVEDAIEQSYTLEVSSPGIERRLRRPEHFERQLGGRVHVVLGRELGGRKKITGRLSGVRKTEIDLELDDGERLVVPLDAVKRANLKVF